MEQKKLLTVVGISILLLYFLAAFIWLINFQTDIKAQNVQQLMLL
ncbi:MAG: hypothetical protein WC624_01160 [Candidatus Margulisiibacteriota bacterium]